MSPAPDTSSPHAGAPIRVVIAKPGSTATTAGQSPSLARFATPAWRSSTPGCNQTPEQVVEAAVQEDARAIGLSILSGAHMTLFRRVIDLLAERGATDIVCVRRRHHPGRGHPAAQGDGVSPRCFTPGNDDDDDRRLGDGTRLARRRSLTPRRVRSLSARPGTSGCSAPSCCSTR